MVVIGCSSRRDDSDRRVKPASQLNSFQIRFPHPAAKLGATF
jgi:hypothetical protein